MRSPGGCVRCWWLIGLAAVAACAAPPAGDPSIHLTSAEDKLARGEFDAAVDLLESLDPDSVAGENLERLQARLAQALARSGELWDAFEVIRDFTETHAFSSFLAEMQDLEYEIGTRLIQSSWRFLFFASDESDGQIVLEHFIQRFPRHPSTPDALRLLGEKAFREQDWALARERFREIVLRHGDSEWAPLARFRIAMASFFQLEGPAYDQRAMQETHNELRDFLELRVENPGFEAEARQAWATTRAWLATKHLMIADFYRVLGNAHAEHAHLLAAHDFPETEAGAEAGKRLEAEPKQGPVGEK